jgi:hypothetical protein
MQPPQPGSEFHSREQLKSARHLFDAKRTAFGIVQPVQLSD